MFLERKKERIYPKDFQDYSVELLLGDIAFTGNLGNISEGGMCAIIASSSKLDVQIGDPVKVTISSKLLDAPIVCDSRAAWMGSTSIRETQHQLLGVEFAEDILLPPSLMALGMSTME